MAPSTFAKVHCNFCRTINHSDVQENSLKTLKFSGTYKYHLRAALSLANYELIPVSRQFALHLPPEIDAAQPIHIIRHTRSDSNSFGNCRCRRPFAVRHRLRCSRKYMLYICPLCTSVHVSNRRPKSITHFARRASFRASTAFFGAPTQFALRPRARLLT